MTESYFGSVAYEPTKEQDLQRTLAMSLGPEYISERSGPGGTKLKYLEGWKLNNIANEVLGFNGWSHSIVQQTVDFVDCEGGRFSVGVSTTVRVTLKDGAYHEDVGYGSMENCKQKGAALEKAKKESVTDALKRTLKHFGNIMGNCIYSKEYLKSISKMPKVQPLSIDPMYRSKQHAPDAPVQVKTETDITKNKENERPTTATKDSKDAFMDSDDDIYMAADLECYSPEMLGNLPPKTLSNEGVQKTTGEPRQFQRSTTVPNLPTNFGVNTALQLNKKHNIPTNQ